MSERIDTTSASGKMIFRLMAVLNEFERDQVAERTSAVLQHKKAQGLVYSPVPYGFERQGDTLVPVEAEQRVLKLMVSLRNQGRSYAWIALHLTDRRIPTKTGGQWHAATVRGMVKR